MIGVQFRGVEFLRLFYQLSSPWQSQFQWNHLFCCQPLQTVSYCLLLVTYWQGSFSTWHSWYERGKNNRKKKRHQVQNYTQQTKLFFRMAHIKNEYIFHKASHLVKCLFNFISLSCSTLFRKNLAMKWFDFLHFSSH